MPTAGWPCRAHRDADFNDWTKAILEKITDELRVLQTLRQARNLYGVVRCRCEVVVASVQLSALGYAELP